MKYIEELIPGNSFLYKNQYFIVTSDFKSNQQKLCYNIQSGHAMWFDPDSIVDDIQIYTMDDKNTIIPISKTPKLENENVDFYKN